MMRVVWEHAGEEHHRRINDGERVLIGRSRACEVSLAHPSLSKRHAELVREGLTLAVRDLGSRNGVRVNGTPVAAAELEEGDVVQCGALRLQVQGLASSTPLEELEASGFSLVEEDGPRAMRLRVVAGGPPAAWELAGPRLVIGSAPGADIVLAAEGVSRRHAELALLDGEWVARDLGSRNGLLLDGVRVESRALFEGDLLQLGALRLRFEPAPPEGLLDSVVTRLRRRTRTRSLQAATLALALGTIGPVLAWTQVNGAAGQSQDDPVAAHLETGLRALSEGRHELATDSLARARRAAHEAGRAEDVPWLEALRAAAAHWQGLKKGPLLFRWDKAEDLLARAAGFERHLPGPARDWLAAQGELVRLNRAAYEGLGAADRALSALQAARELAPALAAVETGLSACERVPAASPLAEGVPARRQALRAGGLAALEAEVARRLEGQNPDWEVTRRLLERGEPLADDLEARARLRGQVELCQVNLRENEAFRRAFALLEAGDPARRAEAVRALEAINPRAQVSREARAVLARLRGEECLREAARAHAQGDERRVFERLDDLFALGEDVPAELKARAAAARRRCLEVTNGLQLAANLARAGAHDEAERELTRVLELESDPQNRFRRLAEEELTHLVRLRREALDALLLKGEAALAEAAFAQARALFRQARETRGVSEADLGRVRAAVAREKARLAEVLTDLRLGRTQRLAEQGALCELLLEWLPGTDPERARAERTLGEVQKEQDRGQKRATLGLAR